MKKPVLLVLAAGLGSRYGGLKQLESISHHGQLILDYSIYDAKRAGFEEVIFVIRPDTEEAFRETIGSRIGNQMRVRYAHQTISDLPEGFTLPEGRTKPWGTAHAVLAARDMISGPFVTVNADDFYGASSYQKIYDFLSTHSDTEHHYQYGLVGYALKNTVTDHGSVSRGICMVDEAQRLTKIDERTHIEKNGDAPRFTLDGGNTWENLSADAIVSMNLWGFSESYLKEAYEGFQVFLKNMSDPLKNEYYLPTVADDLIKAGKSQVTVVPSEEMWYGITYPEDRVQVVEAISQMTQKGLYPENLWQNNKN